MLMQGPSTKFKKGAPGHTSQMLFIETPPLVPNVPIAKQTTQLKAPTPAAVVAKTPKTARNHPVAPAPKPVHVVAKHIPKAAPKVIAAELPTELAHAAPEDISTPPIPEEIATTSTDSISTDQAAAIPAAVSSPAESAAEMAPIVTQVAPSAGGNGGAYGTANSSDAIALYLSRVASKVKPNLQYLVNLKRIRLKGEVGVRFTILDSGMVSGLEVVETSGRIDLDQTAKAAVLRAQPFERPTVLSANSRTVRIPVVFKPDL